MSSQDQRTRNKSGRFVALMLDAPKPLLMNCKLGADRLGPEAALYGEFNSELELPILYGHVGIPVFSTSFPMDQSWESLERWLGYVGSQRLNWLRPFRTAPGSPRVMASPAWTILVQSVRFPTGDRKLFVGWRDPESNAGSRNPT